MLRISAPIKLGYISRKIIDSLLIKLLFKANSLATRRLVVDDADDVIVA